MESANAGPAPRLGLFATAMLVMGGIVGSGIFMNPHVVAKDAPSSAAVLAAWTLGGAVALQAFVNISVVLGLMPTKGIPLPFVSAGGSSLLINLVGMGILLNVSQHASPEA